MRITRALILTVLLLLATWTLAQMKNPIPDDGTPIDMGSSVKLNSSGQLETCDDNDSLFAGVVTAVQDVGGTDYYTISSSDVYPAKLDLGVTAGDLLTTSSGGTFKTASSGEIVVGVAIQDGHATELRKAVFTVDRPTSAAIDWDTLAAYADTTVTNSILDSLGAYADTSIVWDTLTAYLDTTSDFFDQLRANGNPWLTDSVTFVEGTNVTLTQTGDSITISADGADNDWSGAGTGQMYATDSDDSVAIGITVPTAKLDVDGGVTMRGDRYRGIDASGADSFWVYDDGDTTRIESDNPIKVGNNSLIVETNGNVIASDTLFIGDVEEDTGTDSLLVIASDGKVGWTSLTDASSANVSSYKIHRTDSIINPTTDTWTSFKMTEEVAEETIGLSLTWPVAGDSTRLLVNEEGLYQFGGCIHYLNPGVSSITGSRILSRLLQNTDEARCSQREWHGNIDGYGRQTLDYSGTIYCEVNDTLQLQYYTNTSQIRFINDPNFSNRVAATLWMIKLK